MSIPLSTNDRLQSASNREVNTGIASMGVTQDSLLAGEDLVVNVLKVEQRFNYAFSQAVGTTPIKGSAGFVHGILLGSTSAGGALTIYDSPAGTNGTIIGIIKPSANEGFYNFDVTAANGIVVANVGTQIYTVSYR